MKSLPILVSTAVLRIVAVGFITGSRNRYPGKLPVVEEGTNDECLLVKGDPIADPEKNCAVIMKG